MGGKKQSLMNYVFYNQLLDEYDNWRGKSMVIGISYSEPSYDIAINLSRKLSEDNFSVIIDEKSINDYNRSISLLEENLAKQPLFVPFLSQRYFESYHCMRELYLFFKQHKYNKERIVKHILPIWCEYIDYQELSKTASLYWTKVFYNSFIQGNYTIFDEETFVSIVSKCQKIIVILADISAVKINDNIDLSYRNIKDSILMKFDQIRFDAE